jgi:ribosomal protein S18 acetylase RimI-like enzyme
MFKILPIITKDEIQSITKVINAAFSSVAKQYGYTRELVPTFPAFIDELVIQKQINNGMNLFGYSLNDKYVGSIGYVKSIQDDLFIIERLAVIQEFRHQSIGKSLMKYAIEQIKHENGEIVEVQIVNENNLLKQWYLQQGFEEIRIDDYKHLPFRVGILQLKI